MLVPTRHGSSDSYRYGFNGMENDNEIKGEGNSINYEARMQDTRVGRFLSIDPLSKNFPHYSPYQFAGNTPIQAIDLDGAEEYHYLAKWDKKSGKIIFKLESDKTVGRKTFLGFSWIPSETHTVVYQNSNSETTEYVFPKNGKVISYGGIAFARANKPSSLSKFVTDATTIIYQNEDDAERAFSIDFLSTGGAFAFDVGNATYSTSQLNRFATKVPVEKDAPKISSVEDDINWGTRPKFWKETDKAAVKRATNGAGQIECVKCETPLTGQKQANGKRDYQLGHTDGNEWAKQKDGYNKKKSTQGKTTDRKTVIKNYQKDVEVECVRCNTSHGGKYGNSRKKR